MKKAISITLGILLAAAILYFVLIKGSTGDQEQKKVVRLSSLGIPFVKVNRKLWRTSWDEENRAGGVCYEIAKKYLQGDAQKNGGIVGGFFKAIDLVPTKSRAKYFKKALLLYAEQVGLTHWEIGSSGILAEDGGADNTRLNEQIAYSGNFGNTGIYNP